MPTPRRALLLALAAAPVLAGCGFALRQAHQFAFRSIHLALPANSALGTELRRQLEGTGGVQVIQDAARASQADVVLESAGEQRVRTVVSSTATSAASRSIWRNPPGASCCPRPRSSARSTRATPNRPRCPRRPRR